MRREWAIETGIIERLYTWDRGVTELLIEQGIEAQTIAHHAGLPADQAQSAKDLIDDQSSALEGLYGFIKGESPLTEHYIRQLHAELTRHQHTTEAVNGGGRLVQVTLRRGEYKQHPNNPRRPDGEAHEYCPPERTNDEMQQMIKYYHRYHDQNVSAPVLSAWIHHRFTQIHPFQDGNGRVARALATLVFLKKGLFPIVVRDQHREVYINCLENADQGDLGPLIHFFVQRQKAALLQALSLEHEVTRDARTTAIIESTLQVLREKAEASREKLDGVFPIAEKLQNQAIQHMEGIAQGLSQNLGTVTPIGGQPYSSWCNHGSTNDEKGHYFHEEIIEMAKIFEYFANLERFGAWIRLGIKTSNQFELIICIHGYGPRNNGIMAACAFSHIRGQDENGQSRATLTQPACTDLFQFNYAEKEDSVQQRFDDWLNTAMDLGLTNWNRIISSQ